MPPGVIAFFLEHRSEYNRQWNAGVEINNRQWAMAPKADELRAKLLSSQSAADQTAAARALLAQLKERLDLLHVLYNDVIWAAEALKPITSPRGFAGHERFWVGIEGDPLP